MQKSRPLGVTFIAICALVGSGMMFASAIVMFAEFWGDVAHTLTVLQATAAPLGFVPDTTPAGNIYIMLVFGAFFAGVGVYTLRRSRFAWLANVGMSVAAIVLMTAVFSGHFYGVIEAENIDVFSELVAVGLFVFVAIITASVIRLYYLFWPNVREFFGIKSLSVKTQTT
jgi:hypothetical protein